jgi:Mg2+ and Co2+ transporter CorA
MFNQIFTALKSRLWKSTEIFRAPYAKRVHRHRTEYARLSRATYLHPLRAHMRLHVIRGSHTYGNHRLLIVFVLHSTCSAFSLFPVTVPLPVYIYANKRFLISIHFCPTRIFVYALCIFIRFGRKMKNQ